MKAKNRIPTMKIFICCVVLIYAGFVISQRVTQKSPSEDSTKQVQDNQGSAVTNNPVLETLQIVSSTFESTLRSCLGPNCFDEKVPLPDGSLVDRVGLLAPLQSGGEDILSTLLSLIDAPKGHLIDLILETHVPAYGYGKNHGWSRIIRLHRKIAPHALSLTARFRLDETASHNISDESVGALSTALDIQVRQLVRWHCRLNHVAAHTKLLTVFVEDLLEKPAAILEMMLTFIGFKFSRPKLLEAIPEFVSRLRETLSFSTEHYSSLSNGKVSASSVEKKYFNADTHMQSNPYELLKIPPEYLSITASALSNEIATTDGLTRWPCESFRKIKAFGTADDPSLKDHIKKIKKRLVMTSQMLAANCSNPFVVCSVPFDKSGG